MNIWTLSINYVLSNIPKQILQDVFVHRYSTYRQSPLSLEDRIKSEVIYGRVLPDMKIEFGIPVWLPLANAHLEQQHHTGSEYQAIATFDKAALGGRSIISAIGVAYTNPYLGRFGASTRPHSNSVLLGAANHLANAHAATPLNTSTRVSLINENAVLIRDAGILPPSSHLKVMLSLDDELSNIKPKSIPWFKRLVLLAVKAYVYNELVITLDQGKLYGGQELGRYREIVDSYADANELYEELLDEKIGKLFYLNDEDTMTQHVRLMLGGPR